MSNFLNLLAAGLTSGAIYGIFGACLAVWFRVCNVLNLAVGDFAMIGAIGTAVLVQSSGLPFGAAIVVDLVAVALIAWLFDRLVLHFAFDRSGGGAHGVVGVFFYTFGLSLVLEGAVRALFGTDVHGAPAIWSGPALAIAGFHVQRAGILVIALAVVSGLALWAYLRFTVSGRAASAAGESTLGSRIVGIDSALFRRRIFIMTAVLAALFGIVESPMSGFTYSSGPTISLIGVVAAGFAAFRKPGRAVAAGLAMGVAEAMLGGYVSTSYNDVLLYAILFGIIILRPEVLGLRTRPA
ncbi:MAG: branched-chain amino acid ABC transporter permease [Streptosporangiales bacterium]|jgi:branched-chain amino acid transport system permease protein|nr:branched-chain amino acid ABC transporter permease [Streptosporangiales bacterium]